VLHNEVNVKITKMTHAFPLLIVIGMLQIQLQNSILRIQNSHRIARNCAMSANGSYCLMKMG